MIDTSLFPYENHPYRLEFGEKKEKTVCFFSCNEHLQKYLNRYKLDKRTIKVDYRDGEPTKPSKTNKNRVEQGTGKKSSRSTSGSTRSTKKLDKPGTPSRTRKPKSK
jgi:hypothetical protein